MRKGQRAPDILAHVNIISNLRSNASAHREHV